jgi:hypothetical protein
MITQTLTHWFRKLFAWWPWKRSTQVSYSQPVSGGNRNNVQESLCCTAVNSTEPTFPWTEGTSIALEQEIADDNSNASPHTIDQEPSNPSPTVIRPSRTTDRLPPLEIEQNEQNEQIMPSILPDQPIDHPHSEQRLAFLHYLVKQGVFNEGFPNGQEPDQYKRR